MSAPRPGCRLYAERLFTLQSLLLPDRISVLCRLPGAVAAFAGLACLRIPPRISSAPAAHNDRPASLTNRTSGGTQAPGTEPPHGRNQGSVGGMFRLGREPSRARQIEATRRSTCISFRIAPFRAAASPQGQGAVGFGPVPDETSLSALALSTPD